jgi:hypothetical protein
VIKLVEHMLDFFCSEDRID